MAHFWLNASKVVKNDSFNTLKGPGWEVWPRFEGQEGDTGPKFVIFGSEMIDQATNFQTLGPEDPN